MNPGTTSRLGAGHLLGLVLVALPAILLAFHPIDSADIWFHLATGDLVTRAKALPASDPFSTTPLPGPWIVHDWLAAVLLAGVYRIGGGAALVLLSTGVFVAALALPLVLATRRSAVLWPFAAALLLATLIAYERFFVRPEMFTLLAASIWSCALAAGGPRTWRGLALFVALQAMWTNLHGAFLLGPFLAGLAVAGQVVDGLLGRADEEPDQPGTSAWRRVAAIPRPRRVLPIAAALACLANPYGVRLLLHILRAGRELGAARLRAGIVEWQPTFSQPVAGDLVLMLFVAGLLATVAAAVVGRRHVRASELFVVGAMTILAITSRRHLALDAVVALPLAAGWLARQRAVTKRVDGRRWQPATLLPAVLIPAFAVVLALDIARGDFYSRFGPPRTLGWGFSTADHPIGAGDFVAGHRLEGPLFNNIAAGSHLIWRLRGTPPVLVDGRLLDPDLFGLYRRCLESPSDFDAFAAARGFRLVVLALQPFPPVRLFRHLVDAPEWSLVYIDGEGAVFVTSAVRERAGLPVISLESALPAETAPTGSRGGPLRRCDPGAALRRGRVLLQLGFPEPARADLARARLHCPARWDIGLALGTALASTGRAAEAEPLVARALQHVPADSDAWITYGICRAALGDTVGARVAWQRAATLVPEDPRPAELLRRVGAQRSPRPGRSNP